MTALPEPPDEQVRALAVTILKRSEFAFWHDTPWLISFLAWLSGLWETDPVLYWAMLVGLVAVALLLLAHVTWAVRRALAVAPPARPPRPSGRARAVRSEPDPPATAPGRGPAGGGAGGPPRAHRLAGAAVVPGPERGARALRPVAFAARAPRGGAEARMKRSGLIALVAAC